MIASPSPYMDLLASRAPRAASRGLAAAPPLSAALRSYQADTVAFGLEAGSWACFLETGLGKSLIEMEFGIHAAEASNGLTLLLAPLGVTGQMNREAARFGYPACVIRSMADVRAGINICNYDRLHLLDPDAFGAVILDESSILKSFTGKVSRSLRDAFAGHRWRMAASATPAPNDHTELGQTADFLGIMPAGEMLMRWFIADHGRTSAYRLKGHGEESFWDWVASWARMASRPSDLGHPEEDFDLPALRVIRHQVATSVKAPEGSLFSAALSATNMHDVKRQTSSGRAEALAEIVAADPSEPWVLWCDTDYEQDAIVSRLRHIDPERVLDVRGSLASDVKEERLESFSTAGGWLVTKPSICGWGLNWQHCARMAFIGRSYSYEAWYQAVRRVWRYGQSREVHVHLFVSEGEETIGRVLDRKSEEHRQMQAAMADAQRRNRGREAALAVPYSPMKAGALPKWWRDMGSPVACLDDHHGERFAAYNGDAYEILRQMPDASIDLAVYSPPFAGLYIYSNSAADMGNVEDDGEFYRQYRYLAEELGRALRPGRLAVVHVKDLRNLQTVHGHSGLRDFQGELVRVHEANGLAFHSRITIWRCPVRQQATSKGSRLNYKDLLSDASLSMVGTPEYLIVLRRWPQNDAERAMQVPVRHTPDSFPLDQWQAWASPVWGWTEAGDELFETNVLRSQKDSRDEKHICPLPLDISDRAIRLWSNPGDVVLSPFAGVGSEGFSALKAGRRFLGIELKEGYYRQACEYLDGVDRQQTLFGDAS